MNSAYSRLHPLFYIQLVYTPNKYFWMRAKDRLFVAQQNIAPDTTKTLLKYFHIEKPFWSFKLGVTRRPYKKLMEFYYEGLHWDGGAPKTLLPFEVVVQSYLDLSGKWPEIREYNTIK